MIKIYANRWIAKNGNRPSELWERQISTMTGDQLQRVCTACMKRCESGNSWPPDFAEFVALVAEHGGGHLGLTVTDVLAELHRYRNEFYKYSCAEEFDWRHPVLYQICLDLKQLGVEKRLTESGEKAQAAIELAKWEKRTASGVPVPPIRRQLKAPERPSGLTPAMQLAAGNRYVK
ncbi:MULTISPECIES: replication protein P [Yersinia]|uniref:replication protein P n=1 Tax=Yersinia TaxID=629 RepID=UPI001E5BA997|nr:MULTISPECIES: replication protein P [Yersinia]